MSVTKDPSAVLDYVWDWAAWLTDGETIFGVVWIVPSGIVEELTSNTDTDATIWLSGGTAGTAYMVTCRVTTSSGRTDDRSALVRVRQR